MSSQTSPPGLTEVPLPVFVGEFDVASTQQWAHIPPGFRWARVLVRRGPIVGEPVLCEVRDGRVTRAAIETAASSWLREMAAIDPIEPQIPPGLRVAVTIATRERPEQLRCMLASLLASPDPILVLVVDNAPRDERTREVVESLAAGDGRLSYLREMRPGLSVARNTALREVDADVLLFTDDDVEVDSRWVRSHACAYADPSVDSTSGPAFAARLDTRDEVLSETLVAWTKGTRLRRFSLADPPKGLPIFPFSPGVLGGGLNFGVRVEHARSLGGFDEALGAGSPTQGGEDCDFLIRLVRRGGLVEYRPNAFVWHHHRHEPGDFDKQMVGYGLGLGAYLAKLIGEPDALVDITRRIPAAARHFLALRRSSVQAGVAVEQRRSELAAIARGAVRYRRARRAVRSRGGILGDRPLI